MGEVLLHETARALCKCLNMNLSLKGCNYIHFILYIYINYINDSFIFRDTQPSRRKSHNMRLVIGHLDRYDAWINHLASRPDYESGEADSAVGWAKIPYRISEIVRYWYSVQFTFATMGYNGEMQRTANTIKSLAGLCISGVLVRSKNAMPIPSAK